MLTRRSLVTASSRLREGRVLDVVDAELVEVTVPPTERCLDDLVEVVEGLATIDNDPPPDRRLRALQGHLELMDLTPGGASSGQDVDRCVVGNPHDRGAGGEVGGQLVGGRAVPVLHERTEQDISEAHRHREQVRVVPSTPPSRLEDELVHHAEKAAVVRRREADRSSSRRVPRRRLRRARHARRRTSAIALCDRSRSLEAGRQWCEHRDHRLRVDQQSCLRLPEQRGREPVAE